MPVALKNENSQTEITLFLSYLIQALLDTIAPNVFSLNTITFGGPAKLTIAQDITEIANPADYGCTSDNVHRELLQRAIGHIHKAIQDQIDPTQIELYSRLISEHNVSITSLNEFKGISISKCNAKNNLLSTQLALKPLVTALVNIPAAETVLPVATSVKPVVTDPENVSQPQNAPEIVVSTSNVVATATVVPSVTTAVKRVDPLTRTTELTVDSVLDLLFAPKQNMAQLNNPTEANAAPIDYARVQQIHAKLQRIKQIEIQMTYTTKKKQLEPLEVELAAEKAAIDVADRQYYDTVYQQLYDVLTPKILVASNQGYAAGVSSLRK